VIPVSVMLAVPLGVIGAAIATTVRGLPNDIFFKVGLITIIGLTAKNAILIVEFAVTEQRAGKPLLLKGYYNSMQLNFRTKS
jgi:multidrug efflux pump